MQTIEQQVLSKLQAITNQGLLQAAYILRAECDDFIPKWKGDLKKATNPIEENNRVFLESDTEYAAYQYFRNLRHLIINDVMDNMADYQRTEGRLNERKTYQRGYRKVIKENAFTRRSARWFFRALKTKDGIMDKMRNAMVKEINNWL